MIKRGHRMIIKNGLVFLDDRGFTKADIIFDEEIRGIVYVDSDDIEQHAGQTVEEGDISGKMHLDPAKETVIDAAGKYVIPGLVDIHTHGVVNEDASDGDPEGIKKMARFYASRGITSWCPTTMTLSEEELTGAMHAIRSYADMQDETDGLYASCAGIHLEGPFLSLAKKGAQAADHLRKPDAEMLRRLNEASGGLVRMVTVAPEEDTDFAFIREASGICTVSLGHSAADYDTAIRAFAAGASHVTHMFNGMNGIHHRDPGIIGAAFDSGASVELICDGLHIQPSVISMAESLFTGRISLISDSMRCTGMPDGVYSLGGQPVYVKNKKATLADGTLAGSSITLMDALRNVVEFGLPLEQAVRYASSIPASVIGADTFIGKIRTGYQADMLILDRELNLETTIIKGKASCLLPQKSS